MNVSESLSSELRYSYNTNTYWSIINCNSTEQIYSWDTNSRSPSQEMFLFSRSQEIIIIFWNIP